MMTIRIAINGDGRIGRNTLRALYEAKRNHEIKIVAINDLGGLDIPAYLTQHHAAHGEFPGTAKAENGKPIVNGDVIEVYAERDPIKLPWKDSNIDVAYE